MKEKYIPGEGCLCHAHSEAECGCDVDWTPVEVYELRATISDLETRHAATMLHTQSVVDEANRLREQRDRLHHDLKQASDIYDVVVKQRDRLAEALREIADCDFVITLPDRMDAVRAIAREALGDIKWHKL
jgi:hypothetical protein